MNTQRSMDLVKDHDQRVRLFSQAGVPWYGFDLSEVKAGKEAGMAPGEFKAVVSVFNTPDRPDFFGDVDVIHKGAFRDVLRMAFKGRGAKAWPVVWTHAWGIPPLGPTLAAEETDEGLAVHGRLDLADGGISGEYARSIHRAFLDGSLREFSFAFTVDDTKVEVRERKDANGDTIEGPFGPTYERHIKAGGISEVFEVGPTLVGRHPSTRLIGAKSAANNGKPERQGYAPDDLQAMTARAGSLARHR